MGRASRLEHGIHRIERMGCRAHGVGMPFLQEFAGFLDKFGVRFGEVVLHVLVVADIKEHPFGVAMVAIVIGADSEVIVKSHRALAGSRQL